MVRTTLKVERINDWIFGYSKRALLFVTNAKSYLTEIQRVVCHGHHTAEGHFVIGHPPAAFVWPQYLKNVLSSDHHRAFFSNGIKFKPMSPFDLFYNLMAVFLKNIKLTIK